MFWVVARALLVVYRVFWVVGGFQAVLVVTMVLLSSF